MLEEFLQFYEVKKLYFPESEIAEKYEIDHLNLSTNEDWRIKWLLNFGWNSLFFLKEGFVYTVKCSTQLQVLKKDIKCQTKIFSNFRLLFRSKDEVDMFMSLFEDDINKWKAMALRKCLKSHGITMKQYKEEYENCSRLRRYPL